MEVSYTSNYTHYWMLEMAEKERRVSENSLANLKLGAESRRLGKLRHNFTILPETIQWLKGTGNASDAIDVLVERFKSNGVNSNHTHDKKEDDQLVSDDMYKQIETLQAELDETRSQLEKVKAAERDALEQVISCHSDSFKAAALFKESRTIRKSKKKGSSELANQKFDEALALIDDI